MLIKVLIVDDEKLFREGIASDVDWNRIGMKIVGMAEDGKHALKLAIETSPDIVVTDIKMPYLDGLEFIQEVKKLLPDILFIIISGHDEFKYAKEAMKLGVREFLLKPLDDQELETCLLKIKNEIVANKQNKLENNIRGSILRHKPFFLKDISHFHRIMIIQWDDYYSNEESCIPFYQIIEEFSESSEELFLLELRRGEAVINLLAPTEIGITKTTQTAINNIRKLIESKTSYSITIGIGEVCEELKDLPSSYKNAKIAAGKKFIEGKNHTFTYKENYDSWENKNWEATDWDTLTLIGALKTENIATINSEIEKLILFIGKMGQDSFVYGLIIVGNIFSEALRLVDSTQEQSDDIRSESLETYRKITSQQTIEEMLFELKEFLFRVMTHLSIKREGGRALLFDRIKNYIYRNFTDSSITLQIVADKFNISLGHICSLFNTYSEYTFKEYVTKLRIDFAKDLLVSSDLIVSEIAYRVGYDNPTYFNSLFKKSIGISPGRYRKKYRPVLKNKIIEVSTTTLK